MSGTVQEGSSGGRRFHIHACLGRGGFGEVYRATMSSSGGVRTEVAVKVLREDIDPGSEAVKRLRDEGRLLGALRHPAILRVHDLVLLEGRVALVTEYVEGEDLDGCLSVRGVPGDEAMPLRAVVAVVGEVASALEAAWSSVSPFGNMPIRLVHRDVKPANVRIGRHGEVKLLDFGIARATNLAREAQTATNSMMGSYLYMAPERFHEEQVAPPSDVYALGCILFEGLTRNRLFDGMTLKQIYGTMLSSRKFLAHVEARKTAFGLVGHEPRTAIGELVPARTLALLDAVLHPDPAMRPVAGELARRCEDIVEELEGATLRRWARRRTWPATTPIVGTLDGRDLTARSFQGGEPAGLVVDEVWVTPDAVSPLAVDKGTYSPSDAPPRLPLPALVREIADGDPPSTPGGVPDEDRHRGPTLGGTPEGTDPSPVLYGSAAIDSPSGSLSGEALRVRGRSGVVVVAFAIAGAIVVGGLVWLFVLSPQPGQTPTDVPPQAAASALPEPEPAVLPPVELQRRPAPPTPVPAPVARAEPEPEPEPEAEEVQVEEAQVEELPPPAPPGPSAAALREQGWNTVDGDPNRALALFDEALARRPQDADSLYGRGYALMKLGRTDEASQSMCDARSNGDERLGSEVTSVMARNGLAACP